MLVFVYDNIIEEKLKALYQNDHSELLDITRTLLNTHQVIYWSSLERVCHQQHTIQLFKLTPQGYQTLTHPLSKLHQIAPLTWLKYIGSVEAQRQFLREFIPYFCQHYHGQLINPAKTLLYGLEKHYLLALQQANFPVIHTTIYPNTLSHLNLIEQYQQHEKYIIKPTTGELSNSFSLLSDIDEQWLRYKEPLVGGWIIQPICPAVFNGEYQIVYFGETASHAVHKQYQANGSAVPDQKQRQIQPYTPLASEVQLGLELKQFLNDRFQLQLDYFRFDFLKEKNTLFILEIEMVNPGFFYRYLPAEQQAVIRKNASQYFNQRLEIA